MQLPEELFELHGLGVIRPQDLLERVVGPFLVPYRDGAVPAVEEVEFDRYLVACGLGSGLAEDVLAVFDAWVEGPGGVGAVDVEDGADVVAEDDVDVEATGDEAACLEEVFVVFGEGGGAEGLLSSCIFAFKFLGGRLLLEAAAFIDSS